MSNNRMWSLVILPLAACLTIGVAIAAFQDRGKPSFSADSQNRSPDPTLSASPSVTPSGGSLSWESLIPVIRPILKETFSKMRNLDGEVERDRAISIIQEASVDDGTPEAVVGLGVGGASEENVTVMRADGAQPTIALFKNGAEQPAPLVSPHGATASHGDAVGILPQQDAVIVGSWGIIVTQQNPNGIACSVVAYRWNNASKMFVSNTALSDEIRERFCQVTKTWPGYGAFEL